MRTAWKGSVLSVAIALAACERAPAAPPSAPRILGSPTNVVADGIHRHGNVVMATGADADTLVRQTAARWAARGDQALQTYVDTSSLWDGRGARPAAALAPPPPPDGGSGYADLSYLQASLGSQSLEVTLNGREAVVTFRAAYIGTDAHADLSYGANFMDGKVDIPEQRVGANDGHAMQKAACASALTGGSILPVECLAWAGTVTATARLILSHDCGEYAYGSATSTAWFELPIPDISLGSGGLSVKLGWKKFGLTGPVASGRKTAYQPSCRVEIPDTRRCTTQLISPSGCDDVSDGSIVDPLDGSGHQSCQLYLVQIEESYDGGKTWVVVSSWIQTIC